MTIKYINHNTFDTWLGKGWDFWGRFKVAHKQDGAHLFQVGGNKFPQHEIEKLRKFLNQNH